MSWSLWGVPGTLSMVVAWTAAVVIYRTGPDRSVNRRLAVLLLLEGLWLGGDLGVLFFLDSFAAVRIASLVGTAALAAFPFVYLAFLGIALPTPLVRPFRSRLALWILGAFAAVAATAVFVFPGSFVAPPYAPGWAAWNFRLVGLGESLSQLQGMTHLYGFLAAISVYTRSQCCDSVRRQAFWFAVAFGARDVYVGITQILYPVIRPIQFWGEFIYNPGQGLVYLVYVVLLSYAVLQAQLFDIELRLRVVMRRSTLVAVVAGVFFLGTEILEATVPVDSTILGIVTAGIIVVLLRPLRLLAERVITRFMPVTEPTADHLEARKLEVYRVALEGALQDGEVTGREREILARLRKELEISDEEEAMIQREMRTPAA